MSKPIKMSPKHGVNPCISVCFLCGKDKGEIALLGQIGGKADIEAPQRAILDYEPCDNCKRVMEQGVAFIGVTTEPNNPGQPPIQQCDNVTLYPTGSMVVLRPEAVRRFITDADTAENIIKCGKTFADEQVVRGIMDKYRTDTGHEPPNDTKA